MRTLFEIIEDVKDGGSPEYDELRYALLAIDFLLTDQSQFVIMDLYGKDKLDSKDKIRYERKYKTKRKALNTDPKTFVGSFDPDLPEAQEARNLSKRIFDKFMETKQ